MSPFAWRWWRFAWSLNRTKEVSFCDEQWLPYERWVRLLAGLYVCTLRRASVPVVGSRRSHQAWTAIAVLLVCFSAGLLVRYCAGHWSAPVGPRSQDAGDR